ncbi:MAG: hypothetical protein RIC14_00080 [Filomicrobium sp.]
MIVPISLGMRSNRSRHGHEGGSGFVNCYAENIGEEGKSQYAVYACDGLDSYATVTGSGVRAMQGVEGEGLYVAAGRTINHIDPAGNAVPIGGIISDGLVSMARNRAATAQVGICSDGIFKIAQGTAIASVTDPDLPPANSVCGMDGYFILTTPDGRYFITEINDGFSIDGLDFANAEANPDGLVRGFVRNRDLCLFGNRSTEFHQNTGGSDFPFTRTTSTDVGCLSGASVATVDQTVAWVAHDGTVRLLNGYQGQIISTHEVERLIDGDPNKDSIVGFSWARRGHVFYTLNGTNWTKTFDVGTNRWHDRESDGSSRWRIGSQHNFGGQDIFGDIETGELFTMNPDTYSEGGNPIIMQIETPPVTSFPHRMIHNELMIDVIPGVGLNTTDEHNRDPKIILDYTEDGGATWSTERHISVGVQGQVKRRVRARRLGLAREDGRAYRLTMSAEVVRGVMAMAVDAERLAA